MEHKTEANGEHLVRKDQFNEEVSEWLQNVRRLYKMYQTQIARTKIHK